MAGNVQLSRCLFIFRVYLILNSFILRVVAPIIRAKKGSVRVTEEAEKRYQKWIREKHQEWVECFSAG